MNFGKAIEALKEGKKVTRKGWNGKDMFLWLKPATTIKSEWCKDPLLKNLADANGGEVEALGTICIKTADNKVLTGWLASQTDMLSDDWEFYVEQTNIELWMVRDMDIVDKHSDSTIPGRVRIFENEPYYNLSANMWQGTEVISFPPHMYLDVTFDNSPIKLKS